VQIGTLEDRAGIPPTPAHLTQLIRRMRDGKVTRVLVEPWDDQKLAARVAQESGAQVIPMAAGVGAVKGADTYIEVIDYNVRILTRPGGK
jgi:ABC-type Zn uptake system ZnuABC Zn-binding protein ZnuA